MTSKRIIMSFITPPSIDDIQDLAQSILEHFPDELLAAIEDVTLNVEDFPDDGLLNDLDIEDEFDLLLYFSGTNHNGIVKSSENGECTLTLYRRPLLDAWCDMEEDLSQLLTNILISEVAQSLGYEESRIDALVKSALRQDYDIAS